MIFWARLNCRLSDKRLYNAWSNSITTTIWYTFNMYRCALSYLAANDENSTREWGREKVDHLLMKPRWTFASFVSFIYFFPFFFIVQIGRPVEREREREKDNIFFCVVVSCRTGESQTRVFIFTVTAPVYYMKTYAAVIFNIILLQRRNAKVTQLFWWQ